MLEWIGLILSILGLIPLFLAITWYFKVPRIKMEYSDSVIFPKLRSPSGRRYRVAFIVINQGDDIKITRFRVLIEEQPGVGVYSGDWEIGPVKLESKYRPFKFKGKEFSVYESDVYATIDR